MPGGSWKTYIAALNVLNSHLSFPNAFSKASWLSVYIEVVHGLRLPKNDERRMQPLIKYQSGDEGHDQVWFYPDYRLWRPFLGNPLQ